MSATTTSRLEKCDECNRIEFSGHHMSIHLTLHRKRGIEEPSFQGMTRYSSNVPLEQYTQNIFS